MKIVDHEVVDMASVAIEVIEHVRMVFSQIAMVVCELLLILGGPDEQCSDEAQCCENS